MTGPARVWALPDGRIAVPVGGQPASGVWLIIDAGARTAVALGQLAENAVEITHTPATTHPTALATFPMVEQPAFPTKRHPTTGYVAQRILLQRADLGPWVLTFLDDDRLAFEALTDDDVADWPTLSDELSDDGTGELVPLDEPSAADADQITGPDMVLLTDQLLLGHHPTTACAGHPCVIHSPTDHPMRSWRLVWRAGRGIFERLCAHDRPHPDPDQRNHWVVTLGEDEAAIQSLHPCDGCCVQP